MPAVAKKTKKQFVSLCIKELIKNDVTVSHCDEHVLDMVEKMYCLDLAEMPYLFVQMMNSRNHFLNCSLGQQS